MLLQNISALYLRLSSLGCNSQTRSRNRKNLKSALHSLSCSRMVTETWWNLGLAHTQKRKREECMCKLTEVCYEEMLGKNPDNPLLLRNYAKYLHQVKEENSKAEEFYERAILVDPADGEVLSLYAQLIWETHRDGDRAQHYFDRAVQAAPNDCYVIASYANFLWNSEDSDCGV